MFVWRYGIMKNGSDFTNLDQWISERWLLHDAPYAPLALEKSLEKFIAEMEKKCNEFHAATN
jgi:hypothetical protein